MELALVLDNIRSLHNVGSMFRTADGFGVSKIFLCGYTGTPEQPKLTKVSLGAEKSVAWEKVGPTWRCVEKLRADGWTVIGLEKCEDAVDVASWRPPASSAPGSAAEPKIALVVGNEVNGISPALRKRLDAVVEIPMVGIKESFNVSVACAVALYALTRLR